MEQFESWMDMATYLVPLVLGPILAKVINKNSAQWKNWSGAFAKVVGLLISLADVFRDPRDYKDDVKGLKP